MSEISNYEAQKKKLQGLCDEHNFTFRFFKELSHHAGDHPHQ